jgi:hypothetical protein
MSAPKEGCRPTELGLLGLVQVPSAQSGLSYQTELRVQSVHCSVECFVSPLIKKTYLMSSEFERRKVSVPEEEADGSRREIGSHKIPFNCP